MVERWFGTLMTVVLGLFMAGATARLAALGELAGRGWDLALLVAALVVLYGAALFIVHRRAAAAPPLLLILGVGLLLRLPLIAAPPRLSDDIYRYVWDGRVAASGVHPFRHPPSDTTLTALRDSDWALINNPKLVTIYPPTAQGVFRIGAAVAPGVTGLKGLFLLFEAGLALLLARTVARAPAERWRLLLVWWHPLLLLEGAWSGHVDVVGMLLLGGALAASARPGVAAAAAAGVLAGGAFLVKFLVAPLVPLLTAPRRWLVLAPAFALTVGLLYLPYLAPGVDPLGSLSTYVAKWRSNDFLFGALLRPGTLLDQDQRLLEARQRAAVLLGALLLLIAVWRPSRVGAMQAVLGGTLLLSPVVHPWYVAWLVPLLAVRFSWTWFAFSLTVLLAYHPLPGFLSGAPWRESPLLKSLEYAPVALLGVLETIGAWRGRDRMSSEDRLWSR